MAPECRNFSAIVGSAQGDRCRLAAAYHGRAAKRKDSNFSRWVLDSDLPAHFRISFFRFYHSLFLRRDQWSSPATATPVPFAGRGEQRYPECRMKPTVSPVHLLGGVLADPPDGRVHRGDLRAFGDGTGGIRVAGYWDRGSDRGLLATVVGICRCRAFGVVCFCSGCFGCELGLRNSRADFLSLDGCTDSGALCVVCRGAGSSWRLASPDRYRKRREQIPSSRWRVVGDARKWGVSSW